MVWRRNCCKLLATFSSFIFLLMMTGTIHALSNEITRVSISSSGIEANNFSLVPDMSADGRFVAFQSIASNLVPGDTNRFMDIFVRDRQNKITERVNISSTGVESDDFATQPAISADGRFVAFATFSRFLVPGDHNLATDVFIHDRETGITERVSISSAGVEGNSGSDYPHLSADGRFVTFESLASTLASGDTNFAYDIFVHDRETNITERISVSSTGVEGNNSSLFSVINADGRFVAFESFAHDLVPDDTNNVGDIFVHDRETGITERVSVSSAGVEGNGDSEMPAISADGRFVAFDSLSSNLVSDDTNNAMDIFVHDRQTGQTERMSVSSRGSEGNSDSEMPTISADGRFVAFDSFASNFVPGDNGDMWDVFVHDRQLGQTERLSVSRAGVPGNNDSVFAAISADGRFVAFDSLADNLIANDTNGDYDVFVTHNILNASPRLSFTTPTPTLTWNRLTWALTYEIQVAETDDFAPPFDYSASVDGLEATTSALSNGVHYWRVRGCTAPDTCGRWSEIETFEVDVDG